MGESCGLGSVFEEKSRKMEQKQPHYRCVRTLLEPNPFKILITPLKSNPQTDLESDTERKQKLHRRERTSIYSQRNIVSEASREPEAKGQEKKE